MTIAGLVLAGGNSTRMGRDKAFVPLAGRPMMAHVLARFGPQVGSLAINANGAPDRFAGFGLPVVADDRPNTGPLGGILAGLRWGASLADRPRAIVTVPVDSPFIPEDLVERLVAAQAGQPLVVIAASGERDHPVFGLWPLGIADRLAAWRLTARSQGVRGFLSAEGFAVASWRLADAAADPFYNVNTEDELRRAEAWLAGREGL